MTPVTTRLAVFRREPKARAYLLASVIDDLGVAASGWAGVLLLTKLFTDQRARASVQLPSLVCFLVGALLAGPLADWEPDPACVRGHRWKLVVWGRAIETLGLSSVVASTARGLTLSNILPYMLLSAFMKTALSPTRSAFLVDLLRDEEVRVDAEGRPMLDETGAVLTYKTHLATFEALVLGLGAASTLLGLLLGGLVVRAVHERYELLFAFDIVTNLLFVALVATRCHPERPPGHVHLRDLMLRSSGARRVGGLLSAAARHFVTSTRELAAFLRLPAQRPLLWIMLGDLLIEVLDEFYSPEMMVTQVLKGSDDALRYGSIVWTAANVLVLAAVPLLVQRTRSFGKLFFVAMLLDGLVMAAAGQIAMAGSLRVLVPFVTALTLDHGFRTASGTVSTLAQASASGPSMRGRLFAVAPVFAILGDMFAEALSTPVSERYGIAPMVRGLGVTQVLLVLVMLGLGGATLWRYGVETRGEATA